MVVFIPVIFLTLIFAAEFSNDSGCLKIPLTKQGEMLIFVINRENIPFKLKRKTSSIKS